MSVKIDTGKSVSRKKVEVKDSKKLDTFEWRNRW